MEWCFTDERPIYLQIIEQIERAVVTGVYPLGEKMPGVRELAEQAAVNPNTMQRALAALETSGLLFTRRTSGRFVTQDEAQIRRLRKQLATQLVDQFILDLSALGCDTAEFEEYIPRVREGLK